MSKRKNQGQALIPILIILLIILTVGAGSLYLSLGSLLLSSSSSTGEKVLVSVEGAVENGLMRILRNPNYSGESLQVAAMPCTIDISGLNPWTMTAQCDSGQAIRRLQAEVNFIDGEMIVSNLQEIE
ncbi:hypothetical protein ACFL0Y_00600 [Patescibacteria group bacterium]